MKDDDTLVTDVDLKAATEALETATADLRKFKATAEEQLKAQIQLSAELKKQIDEGLVKHTGLTAEVSELHQKLVRRGGGGSEAQVKSVGRQVAESEALKTFVASGARGSVRIPVSRPDMQAAITSVATSAGELIQNQRIVAPFMLPERRMTVRGLLNQANTNTNMIEYVKESGFTNLAKVVSETAQKPESTITFTTETAPVRTIAHWVHISRQAMDDAPQIQGIIDGRLRYGLDLAEEDELLNGDGTGQHLDGLIPNATAYSAAFAPSMLTIVDKLRLGLLQASLAEFPANGIVIHPTDWARIELTKTTDGAYLFANPQGVAGPTLWGQPVVATQAMDVDTFLVGAFNMAATIWDRMATEVLISSEDRDNFIKNMLTVRAERRLALAIYRPEALIFGDFGNVT